MAVSSKPLVAALVLTGVAGAVAQVLPRSRELHLLALLLDVIPFGAVIAAAAITTARLRHASPPRSRLVVSLYGYCAGAAIAALGVAHLVAVLMVAIDRARGQRFIYDFRFYSLVLLGILLIATGLLAAMQAPRLALGHPRAWRSSLAVWAAILAFNLPLVPLQRPAILFSALAVVQLLLLGGFRRGLSVSIEATAAGEASR